jgi:hypothetical protein
MLRIAVVTKQRKVTPIHNISIVSVVLPLNTVVILSPPIDSSLLDISLVFSSSWPKEFATTTGEELCVESLTR